MTPEQELNWALDMYRQGIPNADKCLDIVSRKMNQQDEPDEQAPKRISIILNIDLNGS